MSKQLLLAIKYKHMFIYFARAQRKQSKANGGAAERETESEESFMKRHTKSATVSREPTESISNASPVLHSSHSRRSNRFLTMQIVV